MTKRTVWPVPEGFVWPTKPTSLRSCHKFLERLIETRSELLEDRWLGTDVKHRVRCAEGHLCSPHPNNVIKGRGICRVCAGNDPADAERRTRDECNRQGGTFVGPYTGVHTPCPMICQEGHKCAPHPSNVIKGQGICRTCSGKDPADAERRTRGMVESQGHTFIGPYVDSRTPCPMICREGHKCTPRPVHVLSGHGICRVCADQIHDAFYVVHNPVAGTLKFGVTSGNPKGRLSHHRCEGYTEVLRTFDALPDGEAKGLEDELILLMKLAGVTPVRGREYYPDTARNVVLGFVDDWLGEHA